VLEWHPYVKDQTMGLNHQLASLSCALAEAHGLGRTLRLPDRICLFSLHTERWPGSSGVGERCVPFDYFFDVPLLSRLVPIQLRPAKSFSRQLHFTDDAAMRIVDNKWSTRRVRMEYPCDGRFPLVRRRVNGFWFSQCTSRVADTAGLMRAVHLKLGSQEHAPLPLNVLLRSGLFYAPRIKAAATAIRARIGAEYISVHVRRSDKLTACSPEDCKKRDMSTRPDGIRRTLRLWFPVGSHVYIGSTERPDFFASLRDSYTLHFAEDFAQELVNITNNYALYAVETLVFFGSSASIETLGYATGWFVDACFPAAQLRTGGTTRPGTKRQVGSGASNQSIVVECRDQSSLLVNGVLYGPACVDNPPCGKQMFLVPPPSDCVRKLPTSVRLRSADRGVSRCSAMASGHAGRPGARARHRGATLVST